MLWRDRNYLTSWFAKFIGFAVEPHAWQRSLASAQVVRNQLIRIPTGMGRRLISSPHGDGIASPHHVTLSRARALLIKLIDAYAKFDYALTKIEVQKLAYFLQVAGEDLKLRYTKQQFGPYADQLRHLLIDMEGTLLGGVTTDAPRAEIRLMPEATAMADRLLERDTEARARLERVGQLIRGYETPYSMELLATVHWVAAHEGARSLTEARDLVQRWNERKKARYQERHIEKAWQRLESEGWIGGVGRAMI